MAEVDDGGLGHVILDESGIVHASASLAQATGHALSRLSQMRSWLDLLHPADRPKLLRRSAGPAYADARLMRADGTTLAAHAIVREVQTKAGRRLVVATFRRIMPPARPEGDAEPGLVEKLVAASLEGSNPSMEAFERVGTRFGVAVDAGSIDDFVERFARAGLGKLRVEERRPTQLVVSSTPDGNVSPTSCALKLGYLRAAATRLSGQPTLATETWCHRRGDPHCRFVLQVR